MRHLILLTSHSVFYMSCILIFIHSRSVCITERWKIPVDGEVECCKVLCIVVFSLLPVNHKSCLAFRCVGPSSFFLFCFKKEESRAVLPLKHYSFTYITIRPLKAILSQTHCCFQSHICTSGRNFDSVYCQQSFHISSAPMLFSVCRIRVSMKQVLGRLSIVWQLSVFCGPDSLGRQISS